MKRGEFIGRVAGGALAISDAGAMTDEGPFAATEIKSSPLRQATCGEGVAAIQPWQTTKVRPTAMPLGRGMR